MQSGEIKDSQISASSEYSHDHAAQHGRLNFHRQNYGQAWSAVGNDSNPWLQVDFENLAVVTKVLTQGRGDRPQWVTTFTLSYSYSGDQFQQYIENGVEKVIAVA